MSIVSPAMTNRTPFIRLTGLLAAGFLLLAACSDDEASSNDGTETTVADTAAPDTTVADTAAPETTEPAPTWETVDAPADCQCADGSPFQYFVRKADPAKVMFFMEGGGACFSKETCAPDSDTYKKEVGDGGAGRDGGIFDFANPDNPFADWSIVYVPYCTGDVHIGNTTTDYGDGVVINHKGYINGTTALAAMADMFPDATQLLFAGESGGSIPSPLYAGLGRDLYPAASITVLADGSGAYPDVPVVNQLIGGQWGTMNAVPEWPENAGMTAEMRSLPGLFVQAGKHDPSIVFARHDYAFDNTQVSFAALANIPADDLVSLIDLNETQIEASGIELWSFISPGDSHTILGKDDFYTQEVEGVSLLDWVRALISGGDPSDVHCSGDCLLTA